MSIKGNQLTGLVRVEGYPRESNSGGDRQIEDRFTCQWDSRASLIPSIGARYADDPALLLQSKEIERDGEVAYVTLTYRYPDPLEPGVDEEDTYESRAAVTIDDEGKRLPSVQWTRRMRKKTFELTSANITANVGVRVSPPGVINAGANEWLKTGREISISEEYTEIVDTYEWKSAGWPASYGNGTES